MKSIIVAAAVAFLIACSSSSSNGGGSGDAGADVAADATPEASTDASTCHGMTGSGTVDCTTVIAALCSRRVTCCNAGNACGVLGGGMYTQYPTGCGCLGTSCATIPGTTGNTLCRVPAASCADTCSDQACKSWMVMSSQGADCTQPKFANKMVCGDLASACVASLPLVSCSDFMLGTWNWTQPCQAFWAQF